MMICCTATANPRIGVRLRCDRTAGHESIRDPQSAAHYDFQQDADWTLVDLDDGGAELQVFYRDAGGRA